MSPLSGRPQHERSVQHLRPPPPGAGACAARARAPGRNLDHRAVAADVDLPGDAGRAVHAEGGVAAEGAVLGMEADLLAADAHALVAEGRQAVAAPATDPLELGVGMAG